MQIADLYPYWERERGQLFDGLGQIVKTLRTVRPADEVERRTLPAKVPPLFSAADDRRRRTAACCPGTFDTTFARRHRPDWCRRHSIA
jgi:hypothetical protein